MGSDLLMSQVRDLQAPWPWWGVTWLGYKGSFSSANPSVLCVHLQVGQRETECACLPGMAGCLWFLLRKQTSVLFASAFPGSMSSHILHGPSGPCPSNSWFPASTYSHVSSKSVLLPSFSLLHTPCPKPLFLFTGRSQCFPWVSRPCGSLDMLTPHAL